MRLKVCVPDLLSQPESVCLSCRGLLPGLVWVSALHTFALVQQDGSRCESLLVWGLSARVRYIVRERGRAERGGRHATPVESSPFELPHGAPVVGSSKRFGV